MKKNEHNIVPTAHLRELCIDENWFTCGSINDYYKMFDMNADNQFSLRDVATVIWFCSGEDKSLSDILRRCRIARETYKKYYTTKRFILVNMTDNDSKTGYSNLDLAKERAVTCSKEDGTFFYVIDTCDDDEIVCVIKDGKCYENQL